ncbi:hypothetical protein H5410_026437 [Solanum commersonii]|uniref:Uncharacterized protein n=1 Tax=Solanum commersonii TaxID=4109 RepID=A0A9J5YWJ6_SOLCO|nr:hypothetical protein H5410_026437 [Solanum commersonii]
MSKFFMDSRHDFFYGVDWSGRLNDLFSRSNDPGASIPPFCQFSYAITLAMESVGHNDQTGPFQGQTIPEQAYPHFAYFRVLIVHEFFGDPKFLSQKCQKIKDVR